MKNEKWDSEMEPLTAEKMSSEGALRLLERINEETSKAFIRAYISHKKDPEDPEKKKALEDEIRWMRKNPIIYMTVDNIEDVISTLSKKAEKMMNSKPVPKRRKKKRG